jgi:hypothetical protein
MSKFVVRIDDQLALRLKRIALEQYDGDENAVISDALLLLFLQPIKPVRRRLAKLIYEVREQVQAAGGVAEKDIDHLIREYRQSKKTTS